MTKQSLLPPDLDDQVRSEPQGPISASDLWLLDPTDSSAQAGGDPFSFGPRDLDPLRYHLLTQDPDPGPDHSQIWRYTPTDERRLFTDVRSVADATSFVGRVLLVISRGGDSKNFEEITGQDGLTFGITDFAGNQGCADFFREFSQTYPDAFKELFGQNGQLLLDAAWVTKNNGGGTKVGNNDGLIRFDWLRQGLAQLLGDRRFWGFQLAHFVQGKVNAAVKAHAEHGLRLELTLATMIGIANSYGGAGMRGKFLQPALDAFPADRPEDWQAREHNLAKHMLRAYADRDLQSHPKTQQLFDVGLDGQPGELPTPGSLAHRGNRVLATLKMFPVDPAAEFSGLGHFQLDPECRFAGDPTTA